MMQSDMILGNTYEHYKGNRYECLAIGKMATDEETPVAVYRALHTGLVWVRLLSEVEELVEVDGQMVPRFKKIS